jgi:predicted dehydrogenase
MGRAWGRTIAAQAGVEVVGWVDLVGERAARAAADIGLPTEAVYEDVETALRELKPDFLVDAAVPEAHAEVTLLALERGVAVLGEKPMAATMDEARSLVRASEESGTLFVVSQNRRYDKGVAALREFVIGPLGGAGQLNAEFYRGPHFGGFRDRMDSPLLLDMAVHTFDQARYIAGADAVSVSCSEYNPPWSWFKGAASAIADFELTTGAHFSYEGSWCAQGLETSWQSSWRALGPNGSVSWDGSGELVAEMASGPPASASREVMRWEPAPIGSEGLAGVLADFMAALQGGPKPMTECHDNIKTLAMVMAALESARTGRRTSVTW